MVLGFLGTLVSLERSVALRRRWGYAAPLALGAGGLALVAPAPAPVGRALLVVGTALAALVLSALWRRQRDAATATQILGAVLALGAALLWTRLDVADLLPWLVGYLVLTIAAERVELARITMPAWSGAVLLALASALAAAIVASLLWRVVGAHLVGAVLLALAGWLAHHDVARRTIRSTGLPRFAAAAMLSGYLWLAVAGAVWAIGGPPAGRAAYDTVVHATFLGFAISMVMAHAPVILPAVLHRPLPYRRVLWGPLALLHAGLVLRIGANAVDQPDLWRLGSILGILALATFVLAGAVTSLTAGRRSPRPEPVAAGSPP